jgi:NAD-dependent SIR2 family protein deacetylase
MLSCHVLVRMGSSTTDSEERARCVDCGFTAPPGSDAWVPVEHPPLGTLPSCPECDSTDIVEAH